MSVTSIRIGWDQNSVDFTAAWVNTNVKLSDHVLYSTRLYGDGGKHNDTPLDTRGIELLRTIYAVHGVQNANIDRYRIRVERSSMVDWNEICGEIEKAIRNHCAEAPVVS